MFADTRQLPGSTTEQVRSLSMHFAECDGLPWLMMMMVELTHVRPLCWYTVSAINGTGIPLFRLNAAVVLTSRRRSARCLE